MCSCSSSAFPRDKNKANFLSPIGVIVSQFVVILTISRLVSRCFSAFFAFHMTKCWLPSLRKLNILQDKSTETVSTQLKAQRLHSFLSTVMRREEMWLEDSQLLAGLKDLDCNLIAIKMKNAANNETDKITHTQWWRVSPRSNWVQCRETSGRAGLLRWLV